MFLPVGDSPNPPRTPWLTWGLIAANVLIYLLVSLTFYGFGFQRWEYGSKSGLGPGAGLAATIPGSVRGRGARPPPTWADPGAGRRARRVNPVPSGRWRAPGAASAA